MNIFACKVYKSSNRKDKIKAAIQNPINSELVEQLRSYLDDEYLTTQYFPQEKSTETKEVEVDTKSESPEHGGSMPRTDFGSRSTSFSPGELDFESEEVDLDTEESEAEDVDELEPDEDLEVEESTKVSGKSVKSATALYTPPEVDTNVLASAISQIKGTLNSREDTCGVDNIFVKDRELWIYYNDNVNLNNVMTTVIEILNSTGYYYLVFNRLARKDNAMVFDITLSDKYTESTEEDEDGKE